MAERKEKAPSLPHPTCSKRCGSARPDLPWACATLDSALPGWALAWPHERPHKHQNRWEGQDISGSRDASEGGQYRSSSSWWEVLAVTCNFTFRDFFLRNLLLFEEYVWVSAGYIHRIIKNNHFGKVIQVEVTQFNTLLEAGETRLLRHFSGQVLKIPEYKDSLHLWPLLQDLFTHTMKKFFLLSNAPACVCRLLFYQCTPSRWVAQLSYTLLLDNSREQ